MDGCSNLFVCLTGEVTISPPSMSLTSRFAPQGFSGRYMGVYGFFIVTAWSLGPMIGGWSLDHLAQHSQLAWLIISSGALVAFIGYWIFGRTLPVNYNFREITIRELPLALQLEDCRVDAPKSGE